MSAAVPYIGSKISLISKSEIRYEGILYTIDTKESTVALQNVRSFGTEGRKKEGDQIPPSNEVYDYIIFRGADIKDLHVVETPPQPQVPPARPHDPAIISMQNPSTLPHSNPNQGYPYPNYQYGPMTNPQFQMGPWGYGLPPNQYYAPFAPQNQPGTGQQNLQPTAQNQNQRPQQQPNQQNTLEKKQPQSQSVQPPQEQKSQPQQLVQEPPKPSKAPEPVQNQPQTQVETQAPQVEQNAPQPVQNGENSDAQQHQRHYQQSNRGRGGNQGRGGGGRYNQGDNRGGRGGQRRPNSGNRGQAPNGNKTLDEFDLEAANARFEKEKILSEVAAQADANADKAYDKGSSFFDNISCEATDRLKEKPNEKRKTENDMRKLDAETFGMERLNVRGRGGYRGRGQRRYGYNNNNGNNNNNNNNYNNQNQRDNRQNNQSNSNPSSHQKQVFRPVSGGGSPGNGRDNRNRTENKPQ